MLMAGVASAARPIELGLVNSGAGRPAQADRWYEEGLDLARRVGDTSGETAPSVDRIITETRSGGDGGSGDRSVATDGLIAFVDASRIG